MIDRSDTIGSFNGARFVETEPCGAPFPMDWLDHGDRWGDKTCKLPTGHEGKHTIYPVRGSDQYGAPYTCSCCGKRLVGVGASEQEAIDDAASQFGDHVRGNHQTGQRNIWAGDPYRIVR